MLCKLVIYYLFTEHPEHTDHYSYRYCFEIISLLAKCSVCSGAQKLKINEDNPMHFPCHSGCLERVLLGGSTGPIWYPSEYRQTQLRILQKSRIDCEVIEVVTATGRHKIRVRCRLWAPDGLRAGRASGLRQLKSTRWKSCGGTGASCRNARGAMFLRSTSSTIMWHRGSFSRMRTMADDCVVSELHVRWHQSHECSHLNSPSDSPDNTKKPKERRFRWG